jgi:hypothetical protein
MMASLLIRMILSGPLIRVQKTVIKRNERRVTLKIKFFRR